MKSIPQTYFKVTLVRKYPTNAQVVDLAYFYYIQDAERYAEHELDTNNPNSPLYIQYTDLQSATVYITKDGFMYSANTIEINKGDSNA